MTKKVFQFAQVDQSVLAKRGASLAMGGSGKGVSAMERFSVERCFCPHSVWMVKSFSGVAFCFAESHEARVSWNDDQFLHLLTSLGRSGGL